MTSPRVPAGAWQRVLGCAVTLGVVSLLANVQTAAQMTGRAPVSQALRLTMSQLSNAPATWAGLLVLAGWLVARPRVAAVAGPVAGVVALATHYGLGELGGQFTVTSGFGSNLSWFAAAILFGVPLGILGSLARADDRRGLAARSLVALLPVVDGLSREPWTTTNPSAPQDTADLVTALVLLAVGVPWLVVVTTRRRRPAVPRD